MVIVWRPNLANMTEVQEWLDTALAAHAKIGINTEEGARAKLVRDPATGAFVLDPGLTLAEVAIRNEFGLGVPMRPAFRQAAFDPHTGVAAFAALGESLRASFATADAGGVSAAYEVAGVRVGSRIAQRIRDFSDPANAPLTIERKGFDDPLVDTGELNRSVTAATFVRGRRVRKAAAP